MMTEHSWASRNKNVWHEKMEPLVYWIVQTINIENQKKHWWTNWKYFETQFLKYMHSFKSYEKYKSCLTRNFNKNRFSIYIHFIELNWSKRNNVYLKFENIVSCCCYVQVNRPTAFRKLKKMKLPKKNEWLHFFVSNVFVPTGSTVTFLLVIQENVQKKIKHHLYDIVTRIPKTRQHWQC